MTAAAVLSEASGSSIGKPGFLPLHHFAFLESGRLAGDDMITGGYEGLRLVTEFVRCCDPAYRFLACGIQECAMRGDGSPFLTVQ